MEEQVVLVTANDECIGTMPKMEAHEKGILHRAFSVFIFNVKGELLLQQRAFSKYHSGGLWTNSCCSHQRMGESNDAAAHRRIKEELGIACNLTSKFQFIYKADVGDGLIEHEYDHVFVGRYSGDFDLNPEEVAAIRWIDLQTLNKELKVNKADFTAWFRIIFDQEYDRIAPFFKELV